MNLKILYLSAERNNYLLEQEIKSGIQTITENDRANYTPDSISVTSITVAKDQLDGENDESSVVEKLHSWQSSDLRVEEERENDPLREEIHFNDFYKLAEYLHSYADLNCTNIDTSLHVLWCVENYMPCPGEAVEFYGVFQRLRYWHNTSLNIITNNFDAIEEWVSCLPFQIVCSSREVINDILCTVWRGSLAFSAEEKNGLFPFSDVVLRTESKKATLFTLCGLKQCDTPLYVLPTAEVFGEVSLSSVPLTFLRQGSLSRLCLSPHLTSEQREDNRKVFKRFKVVDGVGTLFRVRYSSQPPSLHGLTATDTHSWKKMVAEGNFELTPSYSFKGHHDVVVFIALPGDTEKDWLHCIALHNPTDYGEDIVKLILQEQIKSPVKSEEQRHKILNLLTNTAHLLTVEVNAFSYLLLNLSDTIKKRLSQKGENISNLWDETKLQVEWETSKTILSQLLNSCSSVSSSGKQDFVLPLDSNVVPESHLCREMWPEFKSLEDQEKKKKNPFLKCNSGEFLCGLSPPPVSTSRKVAGFDAAYLLKCFGEESSGLKTLKDNTGHKEYSIEAVKKMSWREALHTKDHGLYYNSSEETEKFEVLCNRFKDQIMRTETASTVTLFQSHDLGIGTTIKKKAKLKERAKAKPSFSPLKPSVRRKCVETDSCSMLSRGSRRQATRSSPRKGRDIAFGRSPSKRVGGTADEDKGELKPSDLLSAADTSKSKHRKPAVSNQRRNPKPADLSEMHKQKLRNVIVSSLETEGVGMKHDLFKLCFKKMFAVCRPFALDVAGQGATTRNFEKIAKSHVRQVVQFEKRKHN